MPRTLGTVRDPRSMTLSQWGEVRALAWKAAKKFPMPRGFDHDDAVQEGLAYVVANLHKFDPDKSSFVTWAYNMAWFGIEHWQRQVRWEKSRSLRPQHLIAGRQETYFGTLENGTSELDFYIGAVADFSEAELRDKLSVLTTRERFVLHGLAAGYTLDEIGAHLGLGRERVRQIKNEAATKVGWADHINTLETRQLTDDMKREIIQQYRDGYGLRTLAKAHNQGVKAIRNVVEEAGCLRTMIDGRRAYREKTVPMTASGR